MGKKDGLPYGVFKSTIRILFEVASATMVNWSMPALEAGGNQNMYVEVFLDKKVGKSGCKAWLKGCCKKKKKGEGKKQQRGRTATLAEGREMRWRNHNDEQFLLALFTLGNQKLKVAEGDSVKIKAEVFRVRANEENGVIVATLKGSFKAGVLGQVILWTTGAATGKSELQKDEMEGIPHLVLELRPASSRSFSLDEAQPHTKEETIESLRAEMAIQKSCFKRMGNRRLSLAIGSAAGPMRRVSLSGNTDECDSPMSHRLSGSEAINSRRPRPSFVGSLFGKGTGSASQQTSDSPSASRDAFAPRRPSVASGGGSMSASIAPRRSIAAGLPNLLRLTRRTAGAMASEKTAGPANTLGAALTEAVEKAPSDSYTSRFNLLKLLKKKAKTDELRKYDAWTPGTAEEWVGTWKNPWPIEGDDLACKHAVVPLMEGEFRRDCVIFYNTLFPSTQTRGFKTIREMALTRFKKKAGKSRSSREATKSFFGRQTRASPNSEPSLAPEPVEDGDADFDIEARSSLQSKAVSEHSQRPSLDYVPSRASASVPGVPLSPAGRRYLLGQEPDGNGFCRDGTGDLMDSLMEDYTPRISFLKRLYTCFACCGVYYDEGGNSTQMGELWPYPLASLLGHGSRILIRLEDVEGSDFLNFLLTGIPDKVNWKTTGRPPLPLKQRAAATHAVQLQLETGHLSEKKLKTTNATDTMQNIKDGINKKHLGLNMPIGGAGNPSPMGLDHIVGFTGKVLQKLDATSKKMRGKLCSAIGKKVKKLVHIGRKSRSSTASGQSLLGSGGYDGDAEGGDDSLGDKESKATSSDTLRKTGNLGGDSPFDLAETGKMAQTSWQQVPKVQGGHMYIRVDDFGEQVNRHFGADSALSGGTREERLKMFRERIRKGHVQPLEQAVLRRTIDHNTFSPGEIFFPECIPVLPRDRPEHLMGRGEHASGLSGEFNFPRLPRVSSEPSFNTHVGVDAPPDDIKWVNAVIGRSGNRGAPVSLIPPTVAALRLLLHHYNPLGTHLWGTAHFKSVEDLFHELRTATSCIFIDKTGALQRIVEVVVLQLRFRGRLLMRSHERTEGEDTSIQKHTFITTQLTEDQTWHYGLQKVLKDKLGFSSQDLLMQSLEIFAHDPDQFDESLKACHTEIMETMVSPSFPGLFCHYRTHMVQWNISEECDLDIFKMHGLPVNLEQRKLSPHNSDFQTSTGDSQDKFKTLYWTWVPEVEARKLQQWVNLSDATADEEWARQAFQKEGAVQYPPTEAALTILLQRCGIDISSFGSGNRSLTALWRELTNQEGTLHMQGGQPLLAIEAILVYIRWKRKRAEKFDVLVQIEEAHPDGRVDARTKLLGGRKLKEETWSGAAMRCVTERLQVTKQQVCGMLAHRYDDASEYTFVEQRQEATRFPGIETLQRTHLVTYTLGEGVAQTFAGRKVLGLVDGNVSALAPGASSAPKASSADLDEIEEAEEEIPYERSMEMEISTPHGTRTIKFKWLHHTDDRLDGVVEEGVDEVIGCELFEMAKEKVEQHRISSVLLGLEGADPGNVSAFGCGHDASGASSKVSSSGGRKWRAYRTNNALQIPADIGGMRMKINKYMFAELMETCRKMDLLDPGLDVLWEQGVSYPRELLNHRHSEKEFFKQILGGNGAHAHKAVSWMRTYRTKYKTPAQVHASLKLGRPILRRGTGLNREDLSPAKGFREGFDHLPSPRSDDGFSAYEQVPSFQPTLPSAPVSIDLGMSCCASQVLRSAAEGSTILPSHLQTMPSLPRAGVGRRKDAGGRASPGEDQL